jgi:hypothetical protein
MKKKRRIEVVVDRERICVIRRNVPLAAPSPKDPGLPAPEPEKYTGSKRARKEKV